MTRLTKHILLLTAVLPLAFGACDSESETAGDDESASFGIGKADEAAGGFSACELREALEIVNESTSTIEHLRNEIGLHKQAAEGIVAHRIGPDGVQGTGDDDIFDDLKELDDVSFVGPKALEILADFVAVRCAEDLTGRPFISAKTFGGATGGGWTRDSVEMEATMTMSGIKGQKLHELLVTQDARGRSGFQQIRRSDKMEAFSWGYPLDEIPWKSSAHEAREALPFTAWKIEPGNFDYDDDGARELSLGTDKMDDTYYDTVNHDLLEQGMVLRARVRWDTDTEVRRLLIAAKLASEVDADGLKRAGKIDVRTEGGRHKDTLDDDIRNGTVPWSGGATAIEPVRVVWQTLKDAGKLKDIGGETDVLLLDPKVHIKSNRSRYHLNFASNRDMEKGYANGRERVQMMVDYARAALDAGRVESGDVADVEAFIALGSRIIDNSALLDAARDPISQVDSALTDISFPEAFFASAPSDWVTIEKRRLMAVAAESVMDGFADQLDDVDRAVTGTRGLDGDDFVDMFIEWQQRIDTGLAKRTTILPFLSLYRSINGDAATRDKTIADFNTFGAEQLAADDKDFEDFETLDLTTWEALERHLEFEHLKISRRMIEAAGTLSHAMYWELAREYYVPASFRTSSNFIIDTIDFTEMVTEEEWQDLSADQKTPAQLLPPDKVFHSTLVNEVQLELTEVQHYLDRIETLTEAQEATPDDVEVQRNLDGARFVFDTLLDAIKGIAELKEDDLIDGLDDLGATEPVEWVPAQYSKGKTALLLLTDKL